MSRAMMIGPITLTFLGSPAWSVEHWPSFYPHIRMLLSCPRWTTLLQLRNVSPSDCAWIYHHCIQRVEPSVSGAAHCVNLGNRNSTRSRDTISTTSPRTCTHINGGFTTDRMNGLCSFARPSFTSSGCWRKFAYARITVINWFYKLFVSFSPSVP